MTAAPSWVHAPDGARIAYHEVGVGDPAIVFVHGIYGNRGGFGFQEEYFSPNHRCVAVDLRGNGDSDKPDEVYSMAGYADDVAGVIRYLGLDRPVLVGHSMGGQVVIAVAAHYPELVGAVASLDSPSNIPGWQRRFHEPFEHLVTFDGPYREAVHRFLRAAYLPTDDPSHVDSLAERLAGIPDHVIVRAWQAMSAYDPTETLRRLRCPYLYIDCGQPDLDLGLLRELCPQVVIGKTVGAGHKALQDVPDQINAMLDRFIRHADGIAAEMVRTGGDSGTTFPRHRAPGPGVILGRVRGVWSDTSPFPQSTMIRLVTEFYTTSGGLRIAYHEVGSGDPAVIFIHGAYSNRMGFGFQEEYFSPNHRCVAVDLRGHGESDKPDELYTMDRHGHDVAELILHLGLDRPVLVGQSMGGQVIIAVAAHYPELVGAIASLDSPSNIPGWHQRFHGPYDHLMTSDGPFRETLIAFLSAAYLPTDHPSRLGKMAERLAEVPDHVILNSWLGKKDYDPTDTLRKVRSPYLYIDCGQPDLDLGLLRELCPQVVIGKTVGAGHKALQDVPDQINAMLDRFIRHADGIAAEMVRTGGVFQYNFPKVDTPS